MPGILGKNLGGTSETSEKRALQSDVKPPKLATMPSRFDLRQIRDLYHYEYIKIEKDIAKLGGQSSLLCCSETRRQFEEIPSFCLKEEI